MRPSALPKEHRAGVLVPGNDPDGDCHDQGDYILWSRYSLTEKLDQIRWLFNCLAVNIHSDGLLPNALQFSDCQRSPKGLRP